MSYQRTIDLVREISQDYDIEVEIWKDELVTLVQNASLVSIIFSVLFDLFRTLLYI